MHNPLLSLNLSHLNQTKQLNLSDMLFALESGQVIYFPNYAFNLTEAEQQHLLTETVLKPKHKNISYDYQQNRLSGLFDASLHPAMSTFMRNFAVFSHDLVSTLFPNYQNALIWGRTSYRPAEIAGRVTSARKDDKRLHVDAFPSTPVNGLRILRVFCNINPHEAPRLWEVGEPFPKVLHRFRTTLPPYRSLLARFLKWCKATKSLRSAYDHYMLHLHDQMKLSTQYQKTVHKQRIAFPANSTWIVFTDQVSHAALSGQYLLEQTFYLPVSALGFPSLSPLKQLETVLGEPNLINL